MANTHEHLEHAEHAEHHASDPFNQRVAVSMAIVAALLAGISMVGHRTHNKVLQLQGDSNRLLGDVNRVLGESNRIGGESNRLLGDMNRVIGDANRVATEAASAEVEKSNLFAWYQSKRLRQSQFEMAAATAELMPVTDEEARKKAVAGWKAKAAEYGKSNKGTDPKNPEGDNLPDLLRRGDEASKRAGELRAEAAKVREEATTLRQQATAKNAEADKVRAEAAAFRQQAAEKQDDAEHVHHQADRLDLAHLSAEIGLVLCSIALLTKKKAFWFIGLAAAVVAIALTASAYMIPHHPHAPHDAPGHSAPADDKGKPH
jgi:hypothetical protein